MKLRLTFEATFSGISKGSEADIIEDLADWVVSFEEEMRTWVEEITGHSPEDVMFVGADWMAEEEVK